MKQSWQQAGQKVKPGLKIAGKLVLMTALRYGPGRCGGWAIKVCCPQAGQNDAGGRLGPLLQKLANRVSRRYLSR